eukprot:10604516-Alexandrium_andersonii.AAC.1
MFSNCQQSHYQYPSTSPPSLPVLSRHVLANTLAGGILVLQSVVWSLLASLLSFQVSASMYT